MKPQIILRDPKNEFAQDSVTFTGINAASGRDSKVTVLYRDIVQSEPGVISVRAGVEGGGAMHNERQITYTEQKTGKVMIVNEYADDA